MRTIAPEVRPSGFVTLTADTVDSEEPDAAKNYLDRVRAYVPVEVVAFFIFVNALVLGATLTGEVKVKDKAVTILTADGYVAVIALGIGAIATLLYTYIASRRAGQKTWLVQGVVSFLAFLVWAYAIGARAFEVMSMPIIPSVAGLMLATFTLFSGFVVPVKAAGT